MKIYTKTGDKGTTGLIGGVRVDKDNIRIECNGTIDEVNSYIGLLRVKIEESHNWQQPLHKIQSNLMDIMSHIATPVGTKEPDAKSDLLNGASHCEEWINRMTEEMNEPQKFFILPGGNEVAALCHIIRTQMRRAERRLIALHKSEPVAEFILQYINRLSDLFFTMARYELHKSGISEERIRLFVKS